MDLETMKKEVSLMKYIEQTGQKLERIGADEYRLNPCPICGHKDHFTIYPETNSFFSFSCINKGGSIIDYMQEVEGMTLAAALDNLKQLAGGEATLARPTVTQAPAQKPACTMDQAEARQMVEQAQGNPAEYYSKRGLTDKTIKAYKLGYLPGGHKLGQAFKYVLPVTDNFIILRSDNEKDRYRNIGSPEILNLHYITDPSLTGKEIFITEGFFDALSLEELDRPAVALNSITNKGKLIAALEANQDSLKDKLFIIVLDTDTEGTQAAEAIAAAAARLQLRHVLFNLEGYKDINEALTADREGLAQQLSEGLQQQIEAEKTKGTVYEYLKDGFELDQVKRLNEPDILTGLTQLDRTLGGGLYPGLYVLGAISSLGKTALALQLADRIAEQGQAVIFFSLEMGRYEMTCRSLARVAYEQGKDEGITTGDILKTTYKGKDIYSNPAFKAALNEYQEGPAKNLTLLEGDFALTVETLRETVQAYINRTGRRPVVFIDYLQVLKPLELRMTEKQHIDFTIVELKRMARDIDLPVIAVSSFNRASYTEEVSFAAFKESGAIEYTADVVLALQLRGVVADKEGNNINELKAQEPRPLELVVLKNRRGRAYEKIRLDYKPRHNSFFEAH